MKYVFTKWKEIATTLTSGRHIGFYKALIVSDDEKNEEMVSFSSEMLKTYNVITKLDLVLGKALQRREQSIVLMIEKEQNNHRINRLQMIKSYEANCNLSSRIFGHTRQLSLQRENIF